MSYTLPSCNGDPCTLCGGTGMRMDIAAQIVRIKDPTYTCSAAAYLLDRCRDPKASVDSWNCWADKAWGRDRAVFRRCAEIKSFRDELEAL